MQGKKFDTEKVMLQLLPLDALEEVGKVLTFGAAKYGERNWESGIKYGRLFGAALRHLFSWFRGEDRDPETGLSGLAHAACCILFLLAYVIRGKGKVFDDRPKESPWVTEIGPVETETSL